MEMFMFLHTYNVDIVLSCISCEFGELVIVFKVLTFNVTLFMFLHLSKLGLGLGSVADFSNTEARAPTSAERSPLSAWRGIQFLDVRFGLDLW